MIDFQINIICKSNSILGHFNHCHLASKNVKINMHPHKVRSLIKLFLPRREWRVMTWKRSLLICLVIGWRDRGILTKWPERHRYERRQHSIWTADGPRPRQVCLYMCWCDCNVTWRDMTTWHDIIWSKTTPQSLTSREDIHTQTSLHPRARS